MLTVEPTLSSVHLLVLPELHLMDLAGPAQVFADARLGVELRFIGPCTDAMSAQGLAVKDLQPLPDVVPANSCLIVIGSRSMQRQLQEAAARQAVRWLRQYAPQYACIAAVCSGSLLLGRAGLLDGRCCTTHHALLQQLREVAPRAKVRENTLFIEDGRVLTSAGISTGVDLSLHLVSHHWGAAVAQRVAREMVVYQRRTGSEQSLSFWQQHRNHVESQIHAVQDQIMQAPERAWCTAEMATDACLSQRQFRRRFQRATGLSVRQYVQLSRLELGKQLLRQTSLSIACVAQRCGCGDERALRRLFHRYSGVSPAGFRRAGKPWTVFTLSGPFA